MTELIINKISAEEEKKFLNSYDIKSKQYKYVPVPERVLMDVYEDFNINLNYLIADVKDIGSKRSSYSLTITLPDTPLNRQAFGYTGSFGDSNTFNPKLQTKCYVIQEGIVVFTGWLQLKNIKDAVDENDVFYQEFECQIYSSNKNIKTTLGDLKLQDLVFNETNEKWEYTRIVESWDPANGCPFFYPLLDYGWGLTNIQVSQSGKGLYMENFYPAVYVKTLVDKMFATSGYKYISEFFTSEIFKAMIIPYNGSTFMQKRDISERYIPSTGLYETGSFAYNKYFFVGKNSPYTVTRDGYSRILPNQVYPGSILTHNREYILQFDKTTGISGEPFDNTNGQWSVSNNHWTENKSEIYKQQFKTGIRLYVNDTEARGKLKFESHFKQINVVMYRRGNSLIGTSPTWASGQGWVVSRINLMDKNDAKNYQDKGGTFTYEELTFNIAGTNRYGFDAVVEFQFLSNSSYIGNSNEEIAATMPIEFGEQVRFAIEFVETADMISGSTPPYTNTLPQTYTIDPQSYLTNVISLDVIQGSVIDVEKVVPQNMKCADLLDDLVNMFNLYVEPSKSDPSVLYIEPREIFYSKGKALNWETKVDKNREYEMQVIADTSNRTNIFSLKDEKTDALNKQYNAKWGMVYGQYTYDNRNFNSKGDKKISVNFAPSPLVTLNTPGDSHSLSPTEKIDLTSLVKDYNSVKYTGFPNMEFDGSSYRILFAKMMPYGQKTTAPYRGMWMYFNYKRNGNIFDKYPYAGQFDDPVNPNFDLNFAQGQSVFYGKVPGNNENLYPINNLYTFGWKTYLKEISDKNSKLITMYLKLTPQDIANFRFNDRVFISLTDPESSISSGAWCYVQSITEYNPSMRDSFKVELLLTYSSNNATIPDYTGSSGSTSTTPGGPTSVMSSGPDSLMSTDKFRSTDSFRMISGEGNSIAVDKAYVLGDNNTIKPFAEGAIVIGNNIVASQGGVMYSEKPLVQYFNVIDGGRNIVLDPYATTNINVIDGGLNTVRDLGSASVVNVVSGGINEVL